MTIKDWIDIFAIVIGAVLTAVSAIYTKEKQKLNTTTKAGQIMDVVGRLASSAVHEAEYSDMEGKAKRQFAIELVSDALDRMGIKTVNSQIISGAVERAVNVMQIANQDNTSATNDDVAHDVSSDKIVSQGELHE